MKPHHTLAFLASVLALLAAVGWMLPAEGLSLGGMTLRFPAPGDLLPRAPQPEPDLRAILELATDGDSLAAPGPPAPVRVPLEYPDGDPGVLHSAFAALDKAGARPRPLRVLHYGDSQIEGDRITAYLRHKLQSRFGGGGPGLLAVVDPVNSLSVKREHSRNWGRFNVMDRKRRPIAHNRYGAMSVFSRYTPVLPVGAAPDSTAQTATFRLTPLGRGYPTLKGITRARLYYGWHRAPLELALAADGHVLSRETVPPVDSLLVRQWDLEKAPASLEFTLRGPDSPDIFGVSLEGRGGVCVDNIGTRGAAGYEFAPADQALLKRMLDDLDVGLLILQYGGNVVPGMRNAKMVEHYGKNVGRLISRFRRLLPGVGIIVVGPGDMSEKVGERYQTRPWLEEVNQVLRRQALANGAAFWDMYAAMGGRNSMAAWVAADPPLAAPDYTHFSPRGSRKVGELFWQAFQRDFEIWKTGS